MNRNFLSVTKVNSYVKSLLDEDVILSDLFIEGEISNFKAHSSGHLYFSLKDSLSSINCVMFKGSADLLNFTPKDGMKVLIYGRVGVYEKQGKYQVYAELMQSGGKGQLYLTFEALKKRLMEKGYFDESFKKEIPQNPSTVALVTSPTGAAVRDMISTIKYRNPGVQIIISPCLVQGGNAADSIACAIDLVNEWGKADTIIVGRGGGSMEDLWAFNEEAVAEAIFNSKIPIISAVGHETDFTIADFTSDFRASTPTLAAVKAVPEVIVKVDLLSQLSDKLNFSVNKKLQDSVNIFYNMVLSGSFDRFPLKIAKVKEDLTSCFGKLNCNMEDLLHFNCCEISALAARIEEASPMKILSKGYAVIEGEKGFVRSVENLKIAEKIKIKMTDGEISATIDAISKKRQV